MFWCKLLATDTLFANLCACHHQLQAVSNYIRFIIIVRTFIISTARKSFILTYFANPPKINFESQKTLISIEPSNLTSFHGSSSIFGDAVHCNNVSNDFPNPL